MHRIFSGWIIAALVLLAIIAAGTVFIIQQYDRPVPLEIQLLPSATVVGDIYVNGGVAVPGWYPIFPGDTIEDLVAAAGGCTESLPVTFSLSVMSGSETSQKVNINVAESWLLCALPGIGETRALAIIDYRITHGGFRDIDELLNVEGIGPGILANLRQFVTVGE